MALGRQNDNNGTLIVLNLKTTDENRAPIDPKFVVMRKNPETGKFEQTGTETTFSGRLKAVQTKVSDYKKDGKVIDSKEKVDLFVADGDETYLLSLNYNIASRGLFNRLLNLEGFENLEINCWRDAKGYNVLTLRQNNQSVKGRFSKEDIPPAKEVKIRGKIERDYEEVDKFFKEKLNELSEKVKSARPIKTEKVEKEPVATSEDAESDSIPF